MPFNPAARRRTHGTVTGCAALILSSSLMLGACGLLSSSKSEAPPPRVSALPVQSQAPAAEADRPKPPADPVVACGVVFYGDSILHGGYSVDKRLEEPPAATLKRLRPGFTITDLSVSGETLTSRAGGFAAEKRTAKFVVIAHGINDATLLLPIEAPLRSMIAAAQGEGRTVILTGLSRQSPSIPARDIYDRLMRRIALDTGSAFADWGAIPYRSQEMADVLHPAKPYSDRLVMRIAQTLDRLAPECSGV